MLSFCIPLRCVTLINLLSFGVFSLILSSCFMPGNWQLSQCISGSGRLLSSSLPLLFIFVELSPPVIAGNAKIYNFYYWYIYIILIVGVVCGFVFVGYLVSNSLCCLYCVDLQLLCGFLVFVVGVVWIYIFCCWFCVGLQFSLLFCLQSIVNVVQIYSFCCWGCTDLYFVLLCWIYSFCFWQCMDLQFLLLGL